MDLFGAILDKNEQQVKKLIGQGIDVNETDKKNDRRTPLHYACCVNNYNIVKLLLENDAKVNAIDAFGETSFHYAVRHGNLELIELLIDNPYGKKADMYAVNSVGSNFIGESALDIAIVLNKFDVVRLLDKKGITISRKNLKRIAYKAIDYDNLDLLKFAMGKGLDIEEKEYEDTDYGGDDNIYIKRILKSKFNEKLQIFNFFSQRGLMKYVSDVVNLNDIHNKELVVKIIDTMSLQQLCKYMSCSFFSENVFQYTKVKAKIHELTKPC